MVRSLIPVLAALFLPAANVDAQSGDLKSLIEGVEIKRNASSDSTAGLEGEASAANLRIGFVDMNRLFTSHPKTKAAEAELNRSRAAAKADLDDRLAKLKRLMERIEQTGGTQKERLVSEARSMDSAISEFRESQEGVLQEKFVEMRKEIIAEITAVVESVSEEHRLNVLLDLSGMSMGQIPVVVYTNNVFDITDACVERF
jgi:Skp family chaperone for outer membrane proteins